MTQGRDHDWSGFVRRWFGEAAVAFHADHGRAETLSWAGGRLHQDVYDRPEPAAPVVVMVHGIQGYGRMLMPVLAGLWRRGCAVVAPDLPGCGLSATADDKGRRGILDQVAGLEAVLRAAAARGADRPLVASGVSLGAPTVFAAALAVPAVRALAVWNLFSPADPAVLRAAGRFGAATGPLLRAARPLARLAPGLSLPAWLGLALEHLNDTPGFTASMLRDPLITRTSTLGVLQSLQTDLPPRLRWAEWRRPVLVLQPGADRMIPPVATERAFAALTAAAAPRRLELLPGLPHFPATPEPHDAAAGRVVAFLAEAGLLAPAAG
ncbi:alpha/beta hydrolase [Caenispirillum bisanense]|uniref:alpha/beta hydrolase n=1 Tax=Caenispirillum bisanense TaxID=414052 RepID=UPI0031D0E2F8